MQAIYTFSIKSPLLRISESIISHETQPAITCSKLPSKTLEQGLKYVQS